MSELKINLKSWSQIFRKQKYYSSEPQQSFKLDRKAAGDWEFLIKEQMPDKQFQQNNLFR